MMLRPMPISRRKVLRQIGAGVAATAVAPSFAEGSVDTALGKEQAPQKPASEPAHPGRPVRLNRNVNAYGPSDRVTAALRSAVNVNRPAEEELATLCEKIASLHGVAREQIILGCGSSDIIATAAHAFLQSRTKLVAALPTFESIGPYARQAGAELVAVPLREDYAHDLTAMLARCDAATGLVYLCNPNNPTGTLTARRDLDRFLDSLPQTTYVVIDEAYHDYVEKSAEHASFIDRPLNDRRVIVTRSFSKIYGLAGLRIGYAVAATSTANSFAAFRLSDRINVLAARAAAIALDDTEHVRTSMIRNVNDRQEFFNQANARMVRTLDSNTNFVMIDAGRPAVETVAHFKKHDVLLAQPFLRFERYVRVSLGTPRELQEFWRVWDLMPGGHHKMSV